MAGGQTAATASTLGGYVIDVATEAGPRLVGFRRTDGAQLFADLPDLMLEHPGIPDYPLLGGHRLWRAPEIPALTYQPDNTAVSIEASEDRLVVEGAPESDGLVKQLVVGARGGHIMVDHIMRNEGPAPIECAAWAITQMIVGGTAVIPQNLGPVDPAGVRPNRSVVLWPYTDPGATDISWGREAILITGSSNPAPLKIGQPNYEGWIGYAAAGELFVKWTERYDPGLPLLDLGATMQVYRNDRFVELETVGPPRIIAPGDSIEHRETWAIIEIGDIPPSGLWEAIRDLELTPEP
jgi:hypothetical protein